jgi:hypothetical protein
LNSAPAIPARFALLRAFVTIDGVMSTPITLPPGRTCFAARKQLEAGSAAQVHDRLSGPEIGDRLPVPAAETQIGSRRHARQVLLRVAELQARARLAPAAPGRAAECSGLG